MLRPDADGTSNHGGPLMGGLTQLHLEAYRALRAVQLDGVGRINLLVGGNNAGKTSILEAIGLVARPFDPGQWVQTATNRDASGLVLDGLWGLFPASTAIALEAGEDTSTPLGVHADFGHESRRLTATARVFVEQWAEGDRAANEAHFDAHLRVDATVVTQDASTYGHSMDFQSKPQRVPVNHSVRSLRAFALTPVTHRSTTQIITHLSQAINAGVKEQPITLLKMFDPDVNDVLISRSIDRDAIRVDHKKKGIVDLSTFGDGMRRAFAMSLALARAGGGLLLVDEIESAIHTSALRSILPWLARASKTADVQIVASTHSLEAIDAVLGAFPDGDAEVVAYYLRRTDTGHVCRRHDMASLRNLREEGLDIR